MTRRHPLKKKWSVHFVAGNPEIMSKVRTTPSSPMIRSKALEAARVIADKKWRVWVSDEADERIFESDIEKQYLNWLNGNNYEDKDR